MVMLINRGTAGEFVVRDGHVDGVELLPAPTPQAFGGTATCCRLGADRAEACRSRARSSGVPRIVFGNLDEPLLLVGHCSAGGSGQGDEIEACEACLAAPRP